MPKRIYDWKAIQAYYDAGHGFVDCRLRFGFTHGAWNKAIRRGELRASPTGFTDRRRRHDWAQVQAFYNEGNSYRQCHDRFRFSAASWTKAVGRGELVPRARAWPLARVLAEAKCRGNVKARLLEAGLLQNRCSICGISEWRGCALSCHIDHINGINDDNRLENLRMLCPNCHSQTQTYGGRNARRRKHLQESR
jgi:hypothetical protein